MGPVRIPPHPDVLVGSATADDAGVMRLTDEIALVTTVDFFPPMVDDPYDFGRVGAANSLSDVYAMGGRPISAVCIFGLPDAIPASAPAQILQGAVDTLVRADATLLGGHTVRDSEVKFGLAVTGVVHPNRIASNAGARPGDALVLTKPLGSGFLCTALRRGVLSDDEVRGVVDLLATLNREACEAMNEVGVHAATDVTGFGLVGHALGMAQASGVTLRIEAGSVPLVEGLERHATRENVCGGLNRNREYAEGRVAWRAGSALQRDAICDPQTSGGLLISVASDRLPALIAALAARGVPTRAVVGAALSRGEHGLEVV